MFSSVVPSTTDAARQSEWQGALIVLHAAQLVAEEPDVGRRMRLLARAAAVVGQGYGALLAFEPVTEALVPLAVVNGLNPTALPFSGAHSGLTPLPQLTALGLHEGIAGYAARTGEPVIAQDLHADSRFTHALAAPDAAVLGCAPRAVVALPLSHRPVASREPYVMGTLRAGEALLGVLEVAREDGGFAEPVLEALRAVAAQAVLALALARRDDDLRLERQHAADAAEDERRRLARDLHDGPVQAISNAAMTLECADRLLDERPQEARLEMRRTYAALTRTAKDLRGVLFDLRPPTLDAAGLAAALPHLIERMQRDAGPHLTLHLDLPARPPPHIERAIYLIIREALTNVHKHAQATACVVEVRAVPATGTDGRAVQVTVRDNGTGFDPDAVLAHYPHGQSWGLLNMYERARAVTDRFAIHARPGQGTTVEMQIAL
jgi:signal transduction histidine kinase